MRPAGPSPLRHAQLSFIARWLAPRRRAFGTPGFRARTPQRQNYPLTVIPRSVATRNLLFCCSLTKSRSLVRTPAPAGVGAGVSLARDDNWSAAAPVRLALRTTGSGGAPSTPHAKSRSLVRSPEANSLGMKARKWVASSLASVSLVLIFALGLGGVSPAAAQEDSLSRRAAAQGQFERAEALRAALEAKTERERSLRDYENLVSAYRRVYLISPRAAQAPSAIQNAAGLYRRMGEQFEPTYFDSAIENYQVLIRDYPESKYREKALLAIAE